MSHRWKISEHARLRMAQMGLSRRDVLTVIIRPEITRPARIRRGDHARPTDRRVYHVAGRLAVLCDPDRRHVITVVYVGGRFTRPDAPPSAVVARR
jgi:uncharacterized protein DUF4258